MNGEFYSVEDFWAERFIVYPNNSLTDGGTECLPSSEKEEEWRGKSDEPYYTTKPVEGSYFPYGGGPKICKGSFLLSRKR